MFHLLMSFYCSFLICLSFQNLRVYIYLTLIFVSRKLGVTSTHQVIKDVEFYLLNGNILFLFTLTFSKAYWCCPFLFPFSRSLFGKQENFLLFCRKQQSCTTLSLRYLRISSYRYATVVKFGQQAHISGRSPYGISPQVLIKSVLHGHVTLKKLHISNYGWAALQTLTVDTAFGEESIGYFSLGTDDVIIRT